MRRFLLTNTRYKTGNAVTIPKFYVGMQSALNRFLAKDKTTKMNLKRDVCAKLNSSPEHGASLNIRLRRNAKDLVYQKTMAERKKKEKSAAAAASGAAASSI